MKQTAIDHCAAFDLHRELMGAYKAIMENQPTAVVTEGDYGPTSDCYELLIDWDGTLRSTYASEGLFETKDRAENYLTDLVTSGNIHGGWKIVKRIIR